MHPRQQECVSGVRESFHAFTRIEDRAGASRDIHGVSVRNESIIDGELPQDEEMREKDRQRGQEKSDMTIA